MFFGRVQAKGGAGGGGSAQERACDGKRRPVLQRLLTPPGNAVEYFPVRSEKALKKPETRPAACSAGIRDTGIESNNS